MYRYSFLILAVSLLAACTKEVKVKLPEHKEALVISSYTEAYDTLRLQVGKSISIIKYKRNQDLNVANATVVLYTNGVATETMKYDPESSLYSAGVIAEPGKNYSVAVSAPGFNTAEASSEVASAVPITSVRRIPNVRRDMDGQDQDEIRIQFTDPATAGDYYIVRIMPPMPKVDTMIVNYSGGCVNTTDASVESVYNEGIDQNTCLSGDGIFLRDALFNGSTKELRLFINGRSLMPMTDFNGDTTYPVIELYHVPEAYFRFLKSYQFASENLGNPFAEPTNVHSNVKNGYGIFSIVSFDSKEIK